ncbi:MAG TPA: hypothetical protein VN031_01300 [Candidatus Microsaccharimonas sp.]|nr:hypothetical protein [Candidatus Microsaccharimonas sp.]
MATDEVLAKHSADEVLSADRNQLWTWAAEGLCAATVRGFDMDGDVVVDRVYAAVDRIRTGECPTYELL